MEWLAYALAGFGVAVAAGAWIFAAAKDKLNVETFSRLAELIEALVDAVKDDK